MSHLKAGAEINREMKYVRNVLADVDSRIELPDSLRAQALLHKLDGVTQDIPTETKIRELVLPRQKSLRPLVACAAAFLLIVGLVYGIGSQIPSEVASGVLPLEEPGIQQIAPIINGDTADISEPRTGETTPVESTSGPVDVTTPSGDTHTDGGQATDGYSAVDPTIADGGVGGAGMGTRLGEFGDFLLFIQPKDAIDPDHYAPNVLLLFDPNQDVIIARIDIPYMTEITSFYINGTILTLVGVTDGAASVHLFDLTVPENPVTVYTNADDQYND